MRKKYNFNNFETRNSKTLDYGINRSFQVMWFKYVYRTHILSVICNLKSKTNRPIHIRITIQKAKSKHWKLANFVKHANFHQERETGCSGRKGKHLVFSTVTTHLCIIHHFVVTDNFTTLTTFGTKRCDVCRTGVPKVFCFFIIIKAN